MKREQNLQEPQKQALNIPDVRRSCFKQGDRVSVADRLGEFHRYGATKSTAIVIFDNSGLSFCDEDSINYA